MKSVISIFKFFFQGNGWTKNTILRSTSDMKSVISIFKFSRFTEKDGW